MKKRIMRRVIIGTAVLLCFMAAPARAAVPDEISFQGF